VEATADAELRHSGWVSRLVLGDWSTWIRDWPDLVRLSYLAGAAYCFANSMSGHTVRLLLTFVVTLAPRFLNTPRPFDLFFTVTIHTSARLPRARHVGLFVIGFCIGLSIGALYEIYEYVAVQVFGTSNFIGESDTVWDLAMDAVGSAAGSLLLLAWVLWGWGTERRAPRGTVAT